MARGPRASLLLCCARITVCEECWPSFSVAALWMKPGVCAVVGGAHRIHTHMECGA